jgi:hypothetical protein
VNNTDKPPFEPFLTVSLMSVCAPYGNTHERKIALTSNGPGFTAIHTYNAAGARALIADLEKLANILAPPPAPIEVCASPREPRILKKIARKRKARSK